MLAIKDTTSIVLDENKEAAKLAAKITVGNVLCDRAVKIIQPKLPLMAQGYAKTEVGKAVIANVVAGAIVHFAPTNEKAVAASQAMISPAMLNLAGSLNIEEMVNDFIDGINVEALKPEIEAEGE